MNGKVKLAYLFGGIGRCLSISICLLRPVLLFQVAMPLVRVDCQCGHMSKQS